MDFSKLLIVGLGNVGSQYDGTRHNIGFQFIYGLADYCGFSFDNKSRLNSYIASGSYNNLNLILSKPDNYMNLSGISIQKVMSFYKIKPDQIFVVHDDIDLPLAKIKYKFGGSNAGHNGLKSIDHLIGNLYHRVRIGVGRPENPNIPVADFVLGKFSASEQDIINSALRDLINSTFWNYIYSSNYKN